MKVEDNSWQLKLWRVPHLDNLELLHASNITYDYPRHMHEEHCIALMLQGKEVTTCPREIYRAGNQRYRPGIVDGFLVSPVNES